MIDMIDLEKTFGGIKAVNKVSLQIREKEVFGLIGTNGAGKSTLLRIIAGVLRPDAGTALVDRELVYDNPGIKERMFFIADEPYFFANATGEDMKNYYSSVYTTFDRGRFDRLMKDFGLEPLRRIANYSKGMKKQLAVICGISAGTKYLFCDETFDGLDPVMRQGVKSIFAADMSERGLTPVIASHNLRELEDICDHVGLLHQGGVLLSEDMEAMKLGIQKVQCVFRSDQDAAAALEGIEVMNHETRGRLHTITARGTRSEIQGHFQGVELTFFEVLPLTLEEVFISETEVVGYDVKKFILS
ncbi:ABC transporter ATP-binding protein [Lachnoclostridium sp. Marseille-P6806]|uniref:ABC transporter ATP-binding protein n=1 Tax=Lachnoclostridium sp. Marseille-P6806 TaxID=2364793 RepID=UPI0010319844|nr:ABC transporter ATP-binding protein [Lachnoclostridium sp. Marseille-P6806]